MLCVWPRSARSSSSSRAASVGGGEGSSGFGTGVGVLDMAERGRCSGVHPKARTETPPPLPTQPFPTGHRREHCRYAGYNLSQVTLDGRSQQGTGSPRWLCPPMAIFTCTLNPNLLLEAELEAAAAPGRTNPCGRALRMLPWQLPLPGSSTPSRAEGSLCPGITFRVPCWASWQELSPGGARSLEAR